eukprot:TRINITY_DN5331_c0_g1_i2.p1 TRINITY_DN5331_c0_g1~~TRINITY_DN5331_c0_g1_i2.p1  ORF type:complete len:324 (+),score=39.78 TRINITY_DN5331_c0_g1_i2:61-972(+)
MEYLSPTYWLTDWKLWQVQILGMLFLSLLAQVIESKAAMRGCNRNPLPPLFDRFLRVAFLSIIAGPALWGLDSLIGFPIFIPLLVLYMIPYSDLCEQRGGRKHLYARKWAIFDVFKRRFNLKMVKTVDLPEDRSYILGIHPHSVLPFGSMIALGDETKDSQMKQLFPNLEYRTLAATFCFYVPIYRDLLLWGGVVDAARYSARYILNKGYSLALVPGGATEALYCYPDHDVVYLKNRRGFVKLALQTGCSLVPVFSFVSMLWAACYSSESVSGDSLLLVCICQMLMLCHEIQSVCHHDSWLNW